MAERSTTARMATRHVSGPGVRAARTLLAALMATTAAFPVRAQQPSDPTAATQKLKSSRQMLEEAERKARNLQADVASIDQEHANLNRQLQETARLIQRSEALLGTIEARRDELEQQRRLLQGSLDQRHDSIAKLLAAMQRMGRNPPPVIVTRREDALQMVRSAMLLAKAFPELHSQAMELAGKLLELASVVDNIKAERDKLVGETARHRDAQSRLAGLMETKRQTLSERQKELEEVRKAAQDIARSVTDLSELIQRLDKAVADRTPLGAYEREVASAPPVEAATPPAQPANPPAPPQAEAAKPSPSPPPAAGPAPAQEKQVAVLVPPKQPKSAIELAPSGGLMTGSPGRMKPTVAFHLAKGQLPSPAPQGKRVLAFGEKTQRGSSSMGLVIETRHGGQITSPCDGWVVYAGEFRTYGQLLIINAGGGYHVLLAGLSQIDVQLGQFVLASEPVGTMRGLPKGKTQDNSPVLYVEFRKDGRPIDPDPWWAAGS